MARVRDYVPSVRQAFTPGIGRDWATARELGLSIPQWRAAHSARLDLLPALRVLREGLVLDLGANVGDWTAALLLVEPSATVVAVEPGPAPGAKLAKRFADDPRVTVDHRAVADSVGEGEFYVTENSLNASLRAPKPGVGELYGSGWNVDGVTTVGITTVDDLVQDREVRLLKVDVQGAEQDVLRGAHRTLARTGAILLEVTFVSHYSGDATFPLLHEYLSDAGFEMAGLSPPFVSQKGTALWCDACYVRSHG